MDSVSSILLRIGHLAIPAILPVSMRNSLIPLLRQIFDAIFVIFSHFESILMIFRSDYLIFTYRISLSPKSVSRYFPVIISSQIIVKNGYNGYGNHYRITITWRAKSKFSGFQTFWSNIRVQAIFRVRKHGFRAFWADFVLSTIIILQELCINDYFGYITIIIYDQPSFMINQS